MAATAVTSWCRGSWVVLAGRGEATTGSATRDGRASWRRDLWRWSLRRRRFGLGTAAWKLGSGAGLCCGSEQRRRQRGGCGLGLWA
ncbi:hypothetical protein M0R45_019767 [Rubus argutus]|uniref:Uncharacterized protein n=1 Tax=Rubus argutus TaxID=59490 RepID=A0AAW1X787_RUBAR